MRDGGIGVLASFISLLWTGLLVIAGVWLVRHFGLLSEAWLRF